MHMIKDHTHAAVELARRAARKGTMDKAEVIKVRNEWIKDNSKIPSDAHADDAEESSDHAAHADDNEDYEELLGYCMNI